MVPEELSKRSVSAIKWSTLGTLVTYALQLATQIFLARILGPQAYGIFAMILLVFLLSNLLIECPAWALVQTHDLDQQDIHLLFTWQLLLGVIGTVMIYTLAPTISHYFKEEQLSYWLRWMSGVCIINAVNSVQGSLLKRSLNFRRLNIATTFSYFVSYVLVGIPLAYFGAGMWALVGAWSLQALTIMILTYRRELHNSYKVVFWHVKARNMFSIVATVGFTNLCNWTLNNLDRLVLGRFHHPTAVGNYTVAYNLANAPNMLLLTALQPAFLAVGARLQNDQERLRRAYLSILAFIWIVITPLFAILAVSANDLVSVLYGSAWSTAGWVLTVFALAMPAYVIWAMSTPILWNTGKRNYESLLQLPLIPLAAMAYIVFSQRSELAIAIIACVILILRAAVVATFACRRLGIGLDTLYPSIVRGIFITAIAGAVSFGVLTWIHRTGYGSAAAISAAAASSALVLISLVLCFPLLVGNQVIELTGRFSPYVASILTRRRHSFKFS